MRLVLLLVSHAALAVTPADQLQPGQQQFAPLITQQPVLPNNQVLYGVVAPCTFAVPISAQPAAAAYGCLMDIVPPPSFDNDQLMARAYVEQMINDGTADAYATDKQGSRFLQKVFTEGDVRVQQKLLDYFLQKDIFARLCDDIFANYLLQCLMEKAAIHEEVAICSILMENVVEHSCGRYSCRIVQKVFTSFHLNARMALLSALKGAEKCLSLDQYGIHVIQIATAQSPNSAVSLQGVIMQKRTITPEKFMLAATDFFFVFFFFDLM
ncbi:unnamed protein product [Gongylonema pulchrum]|uniref:PUM-HD domain-containing protein n=1 Tax=Gongylonema pulchrum TaxID=637853 RepID=A0A183DZV3_9BILA|nr:unnamed protein product [Gongylonema pulchrum]